MNHAAERYRTVQGKDVPIDHFLYACFEAEKLHEATEPKLSRSPCWPELKPYLGQTEVPEEFEDQQLNHLIEDLLSWYRANFPELANQQAWDFAVISEISHTLAAMGLDLGEVYRLKTGNPLPRFDEPEARNVWGKIENFVQSLFGSRASHIFRYFEWSYGEEKKPEPELGTRPPVGRFSPFFRRQGPSSKPPRSQGSGDDRPRKHGNPGPQRNGDNHKSSQRNQKQRKDGPPFRQKHGGISLKLTSKLRQRF